MVSVPSSRLGVFDFESSFDIQNNARSRYLSVDWCKHSFQRDLAFHNVDDTTRTQPTTTGGGKKRIASRVPTGSSEDMTMEHETEDRPAKRVKATQDMDVDDNNDGIPDDVDADQNDLVTHEHGTTYGIPRGWKYYSTCGLFQEGEEDQEDDGGHYILVQTLEGSEQATENSTGIHTDTLEGYRRLISGIEDIAEELEVPPEDLEREEQSVEVLRRWMERDL